MINFIKRKLARAKIKRNFREYGFSVKEFNLKNSGTVRYAQWLHPFESKKDITQAQVDFYGQFVRPGDFIIDIGAHTGDTTVPMAVATGREGRVLALEPNPYVFKILEENARLNPQAGEIIPLRKAAVEAAGTLTFNYSDASFCNGGYLEKIKHNRHNHNYTLEVEGINLQDYLLAHYAADLPRLSLLKVDAEGYDKEILKTLPRVIEQYQPVVLAECYKRLDREERSDLYRTITQFDYQLFKIQEFELDTTYVPLTETSMTDDKHFEMLAVPGSNHALLARLKQA